LIHSKGVFLLKKLAKSIKIEAIAGHILDECTGKVGHGIAGEIEVERLGICTCKSFV